MREVKFVEVMMMVGAIAAPCSSQAAVHKAKKKKKPVQAQTQNPAIATPVVATPLAVRPNPVKRAHLGFGPALGIVNSTLGYGFSFQFLIDPSPTMPISVGLETGLVHWGNSTETSGFSGSGSVNSIPVLLTGTYSFTPASSRVRAYAGASLGISITPISASFTVAESSYSGSTTSIYFEGLIKPGVQFGKVFFEPKFGLIRGEFIFLPTVGMFFDI